MTSISGTGANQGYSPQKPLAAKGTVEPEASQNTFHDGGPVEFLKIDPSFVTHAVDLSDEDYKVFEERLRRSVPLATPAPPAPYGSDPFVNAQMAPFASIDRPGGRIEVSNAGYVSSGNGAGDLSYLDDLENLTGPARAAKIADRLAERFGGKVRRAQTAVTQQVYDTLASAAKSRPPSTESLLRARDPEIETRLAGIAAARAAGKADRAQDKDKFI